MVLLMRLQLVSSAIVFSSSWTLRAMTCRLWRIAHTCLSSIVYLNHLSATRRFVMQTLGIQFYWGPSFYPSVCLSLTVSIKTAHFRALVTTEHVIPANSWPPPPIGVGCMTTRSGKRLLILYISHKWLSFYQFCSLHFRDRSVAHWISLASTCSYRPKLRYDTIWYDIFTCAQKLTKWPA